MLKIVAVCVAALVLGGVLALDPLNLPVRAGYLGAALLVAAALWVNRHWQQRAAAAGDDPGPAERNAWLWMTGTALIQGFVVAVLLQPGSELHTVSGDTGGFDSWVMIAGLVLAYRILRNPDTRRDERDLAISALGTKASYLSLVVQLTVLLLMLGFSPPDTMQRFTHWLIANSLVTLIMMSALVGWVVVLGCYWRDSRLLRTLP